MNNNLLKLFDGIPEFNGIHDGINSSIDQKSLIIDQQQLCIHSLNMRVAELELSNELLTDLVDELKESLIRIRLHLKKDSSHMWTGPIYQANYVIDEALKKEITKSLGENK